MHPCSTQFISHPLCVFFTAFLALTRIVDPASGADTDLRRDSGSLFDPEHVFDIRIQMAAEDWDQLRGQAHDFTRYFDASYVDDIPTSPYTHFPADVTIDGVLIRNVGVRKKGFLGSVNTVRPSLKLDFDKFVDDQEFRGSSRFTLQNNHTDRALIAQALANHVYALAGVPAPRSNFARVTVNGVDLGIYTHIESVKKPFLRRTFGNDSGNLYEGRLSDFRPEFVKTFEKKTNKKKGDRSDLDAVVKALQSDDDSLLEAVGRVVDIEKFINFWAVTSLIQFWDSYPGSANNFYCYNNPETGKFEFIPWAPDSAFRHGWFMVEERPLSVYADGYLAMRLYGLPEIRERYRERMTELLNTVWNEEEILSEMQRMVTLIQPHSHLPGLVHDNALEDVRSRIAARRAEIQAEFDEPLEAWPYPPQPELAWIDAGELDCEFSFPKEPKPQLNQARLSLTFNGKQQEFAQVALVAQPPGSPSGQWVIIVMGFQHPTGGMGVLLPVPGSYVHDGGLAALDGNQVMSWLVKFDTERNPPNLWMRGYGLNWGTVEFEEEETDDGIMIRGHAKADVRKIPIY